MLKSLPIFALSALALSALAMPANADNFVLNPDFDDDVAHWTYVAGDWAASDELGDPTSGSFEAEVPGHTGTSLRSECFALAGGERLVFGASASFFDTLPQAGRVAATLRFYGQAGCVGESEQTPYPALFAESAVSGWGATQATVVAPAGTQSARLSILLNAIGDEPMKVRVDNAFVVSQATCIGTSKVLCLQNARFRVTARYRTAGGAYGYAGVRPLSGDSAYLWFFSDANLELVLKVLDGCGFNDRFWVFAAGLTNLGVELRIADTWTDATWALDNPLNEAFPPRQDIEAFGACNFAVASSGGI